MLSRPHTGQAPEQQSALLFPTVRLSPFGTELSFWYRPRPIPSDAAAPRSMHPILHCHRRHRFKLFRVGFLIPLARCRRRPVKGRKSYNVTQSRTPAHFQRVSASDCDVFPPLRHSRCARTDQALGFIRVWPGGRQPLSKLVAATCHSFDKGWC